MLHSSHHRLIPNLFTALIPALLLLHGCQASSHLEQTAPIGARGSMASMEATLSADDMSAGPIELQTVISAILRQAMQIERIRFHSGPADIVREANEPLRGVFLTHLHLDHIGGMSEVPRDVPIFAGPGETTESHWKYLFT